MIEHLYQIVQQRAARYPEAIALGSQEGEGWRTVTSRHLSALVDTLAAELAAKGLGNEKSAAGKSGCALLLLALVLLALGLASNFLLGG